MLLNGLGELLNNEVVRHKRFIDLFAGSGAVAVFVAQRYAVPVYSYDLQKYSEILTNAVINRRLKLDWQEIWDLWLSKSKKHFDNFNIPSGKISIKNVEYIRSWCNEQNNLLITKAYGGHYFSPSQAILMDSLLLNLPEIQPARIVAHAALIQAASQCAASPGHTAQPFQPTKTAKPYLAESWSKDVINKTKEAFIILSGQHAVKTGHAIVNDANNAAKTLKDGDLVFIDPPYSGVHYSRFYHVLETIARNHCSEVTGAGRYPSPMERPRSSYSLKTESSIAITDLFKIIASKGATAIVTFPDKKCSNGLSGDLLRDLGKQYFKKIEEKVIHGRFSTLGGNGTNRNARQSSEELVLLLRP